ncbi:MAG: orotidine-5'-phosphate decarboxylase [Actinomycetaceae bacterium]|nr:orotidine-5'-phosphate decarboxylase [Actinomycetaceae bacterium]
MPEAFGARLERAIEERGPVCAGVDPHARLLSAWGLPDTAQGLAEFSKRALEGLAGAAAIKPQSAFFERFGSAGIAVLEELLAGARELGVLTVLDVKRGDIGSTMAGYADAYLPAGAPIEADAITVAPYMGPAAFDATAELAAKHGKGLFALALTSNPEGATLQRSIGEGQTVAGRVVAWAGEKNREFVPENKIGSFGVVIGATIPDRSEVLGEALTGFTGPILMPGFGAQGGSVQASDANLNILVSSSRAILQAGPNPANLRAALEATNLEIRRTLAEVS